MLSLTILGSGSSGNCALLRSDNATLLIDAGLSARQIVLRLDAAGVSPDSLNGVLLTHEHCDHTRGLEILCRTRHIPLFCTPLTQESLAGSLGFKSPPRWRLMQTGAAFEFRDLRIESFTVPHDAVDPVGFVIEDHESRLGVLSDVGYVTNLIKDRLRAAHSLFIEANYDARLLEADTKRPWATKQRISSRHGHLSNDQVADLIADIAHDELHHIVLGHLSEDCNDPDIAARRVMQALHSKNIDGVNVWCADRHQPSRAFEVADRSKAGRYRVVPAHIEEKQLVLL